MFHGRISLHSVLLLLLVNFVSEFRLELMYIFRIVSIRSSLTHPWFSAACTAAIVHRNHLFCLYQQNKSSESKVKVRQTCNLYERVLEAAKLAYANKAKEFIISQKPGSRDYWRIANSVLNKEKLLCFLYSTAQRYRLLLLIKQDCLLKTFLRTLTLTAQVSLYLFSLLELI